MKLKMTLPKRSGLIYTMPVLDVLVLVIIFPLMGSSFTTDAGVGLNLADSPWRFERMKRSIVVTVKGVTDRKLYVNRRLVNERNLLDELETESVTWQGGETVGVILRVDSRVPSGYKTRIENMLLADGYRVFNAGNPASK